MSGAGDVFEAPEFDLVAGGMAAAGGLDGVFGGVKVSGTPRQVDGNAGIGTGVGQGVADRRWC